MFIFLRNVISIFYSLLKFSLIKIFRMKNFHFKLIQRFSPDTKVSIWSKGELYLGDKVRAHSGVKVSVLNDAVLVIKDGVSLNYNSIVVCRKHIEIGEKTMIGPGVFIYDHDHDMKSNKADCYKLGDIIIGKNVWIGANVVILRGTHIGDNCVVGAGTVLKGEYPSNSIIVQKRETSVIREK